MSKLQARIGCICLVFMMLFSTNVTATSEKFSVTTVGDDGGNRVDMSKVEAAKDSVVQVVVQYIDGNSDKYLLKSGSGFLINKTTVVTAYDNVVLSANEKEIASQYLTDETGKEVKLNDESGAGNSCQIGISVYKDVVFTASLSPYSSKEMNIGILTFNEDLNREPVLLGDSDDLEYQSDLYALGFRKLAAMSKNAELLSGDDCKEEVGVFEKLKTESHVKYLFNTCQVDQGNAGGPIVDRDGNVVGMAVFETDESEKEEEKEEKEEKEQEAVEEKDEEPVYSKAVAISEIKSLLDNCRITYQEAGIFNVDETLLDTELEDDPAKNEVDTNLLDTYIVSLMMLDQSQYTPESLTYLSSALENARSVKSDPKVTQEEIDDAVLQMEMAKAALIIKKQVNWPLIIVLAVLGVALLTGIILLILYNKGIIGKKGERESLKTLQQMADSSRQLMYESGASAQLQNQRSGSGMSGKFASQPASNRVGYAGAQDNVTMVLNNGYQGAGDGTMVLGSSSGRSQAYLIRTVTGERIGINRNEFVIGKSSSAGYCIKDNGTVSREHAKLFKSGVNYYVVDLDSTNYTYLNNNLCKAGEEQLVKNGDVIRISNEEFIFMEE